MKQTSTLTRNLADAQENHASLSAVVYRLYTEDYANVLTLVARYFKGATLFNATGVWQGAPELAKVVEIVGTLADYQKVVFLAGDICEANNQKTVLITWARGNTFLFERPTPIRAHEAAE